MLLSALCFNRDYSKGLHNIVFLNIAHFCLITNFNNIFFDFVYYFDKQFSMHSNLYSTFNLKLY